jgi:hypothetical protein
MQLDFAANHAVVSRHVQHMRVLMQHGVLWPNRDVRGTKGWLADS